MNKEEFNKLFDSLSTDEQFKFTFIVHQIVQNDEIESLRSRVKRLEKIVSNLRFKEFSNK